MYGAGVKIKMMFRCSLLILTMATALSAPTIARADFYDEAIKAAAVQDYRKAIRLYSEAIENNNLGVRTIYAVLTNRGQMYKLAGQKSAALADFTRVFELANAPKSARFGALLNRGGTHSAFNDHTKALADYDLLLKTWPDNAVGYYNRGNANARGRRLQKAIEDYSRTLDLEPGFVSALINRGVVYKNLFRYDQALADFHSASRIAPADPSIFANRGVVYMHMSRYALAVGEFDRALKLRPTDIFAHANRAVANLFLGSVVKFKAGVDKVKSLGASSKVIQKLTEYAVYYEREKRREDLE